ncbi:substrate-binding domain-containing protein [Candidatus Neomarinimicrobiota bacterium]
MSQDEQSVMIDQERPGHAWFKILTSIIVVGILVIIIWFSRGIVATSQPQTILLYCFTGMQDVMEHGIFPAFRDYWDDQNGIEVEFIPTFAGSGSIVDKVIARVSADLVVLSSGMDAHRLATKGLTTVAGWKQLPNMGICCRTPLTLLARDGDPANIGGFKDLGRSGLDVIIANPRTSGIGEWSILAIYGSALRSGYDESGALTLLSDIWQNVTSPPPSAQAVLRRFAEDGGHAILTYEANVLPTPRRQLLQGRIVPVQSTVLCEPIVVVLEQNIAEDHRELVHAFAQFLWSEKAQGIFVEYGFHALSDSLNRTRSDFPQYESLFTVDSLGGARTCQQAIIGQFLAGSPAFTPHPQETP